MILVIQWQRCGTSTEGSNYSKRHKISYWLSLQFKKKFQNKNPIKIKKQQKGDEADLGRKNLVEDVALARAKKGTTSQGVQEVGKSTIIIAKQSITTIDTMKIVTEINMIGKSTHIEIGITEVEDALLNNLIK